MDEPVVLGPGQGEAIGRLVMKAGRPELAMAEFRYGPRQSGPDPHVHREHVDAFYVLEGLLEVELGPDRERVLLDPGGFLLVPPNVVHTFNSPGPGHALFLNFHAPGMDFERYVRGEVAFDQHEPPADGGLPASEAIVRAPGAGETVGLGSTQAVIKAGGPDAIGSLALTETTLAPGYPGPVLHRHSSMSDSFYVLDGTLLVGLAGRQIEVGAGAYALAPPGVAHTFSNPSDEPVRMLNAMAPGGFEQYLKEVAAEGGPPDPQRMAAIASKYDFLAA